MVDLDSNPTKLIEVVEIGKQMLITRGALTTFSVANDVAKFFAIVPAMFALGYGVQRRVLNRTLGEDILPPPLVTVVNLRGSKSTGCPPQLLSMSMFTMPDKYAGAFFEPFCLFIGSGHRGFNVRLRS